MAERSTPPTIDKRSTAVSRPHRVAIVIDDCQDEPRSHRLVSDNPNAKADREALWAKGEVDRALSGFAAAMLRIREGNQTEAVYLMDRFADFARSLSSFHEKYGRGISPLN